MAEIRLNPGATSFDDANWEDAAGVADGAELAVVGSNEQIDDGDQNTGVATGVNYWHFRGGSPKLAKDGTNLKVKAAVAYTAKPNFVWATDGGEAAVDFVTNAVNRAVCQARSGKILLVTGDLKETWVGGAGLVYVGAGLDCSVGLYVWENATVIIDEHSTPATDIPLLIVGNNANVIIRRPFAAATILGSGVLGVDNRSGTAAGDVTGYGGRLAPISGVIDGFEFYGGEGIDDSRLEAAASVGVANGINLHAPGLRVPAESDLLDLGTIVNKFPRVGSAGGGGV